MRAASWSCSEMNALVLAVVAPAPEAAAPPDTALAGAAPLPAVDPASTCVRGPS